MDESAMTLAFNKAANPNPESIKPIIRTSTPSLSVADFDIEAFIGDFDDFDMTEDEKHEVLYALWEIMCRFVEIGFGLDSHSLAFKDGATCESFEETPPSDSADLL